MAQRNIIAIGQTGSGKSWFLNQILGKKEFAETSSLDPSKLAITTKSKPMKDNVNNIEYTLNLYDTPDFAQNSEQVLNTLKKVRFDQKVILFNASKEGLHGLKPIAKLLKQTLKSSSEQFTLVMNQMAKDIKDESLIEFFRAAKSILGLDTNECICLKIGEKPKDGIFTYFLWSPDGEHQFQERNFLSIVGQMNQLIVPELKQQQNPNAQPGSVSNNMPISYNHQEYNINISSETRTVPIIYWIITSLLAVAVIVVLILDFKNVTRENTTILSLCIIVVLLIFYFMTSTNLLFNRFLRKHVQQLTNRQENYCVMPIRHESTLQHSSRNPLLTV